MEIQYRPASTSDWDRIVALFGLPKCDCGGPPHDDRCATGITYGPPEDYESLLIEELSGTTKRT